MHEVRKRFFFGSGVGVGGGFGTQHPVLTVFEETWVLATTNLLEWNTI